MTAIGSAFRVASIWFFLTPISFANLRAQSVPTDTQKGTNSIRQIAFSPDGQLLAVAIGEPKQIGRLVVWERESQRIVFSHQEPAGICSVRFSPNGKRIALGMFGPTAKMLSPVTGEVLREFRGHEGHVRSVAFVGDELLATGGYDHTVRLWETATAKEIVNLGEHKGELRDIAVSPDGKWLLTGAASPDVRLWSVAERKQKAEFQPSEYICPVVSFSRDGTLFLTGRWDATLRIQDTSTHAIRAAIRIDTVRGFDLCPHNRILVVCYDQPIISRFHLALSTPTKELAQRIDSLIATWQDDDYVKRERASEEIIALGLVAEPKLNEATKSAAAETRIRARRARELVLSPQPEEVDVGHDSNVGAVRFSPDGSFVASGDADGVVKLWDPESGKVSAEFKVPDLKTPQ